MSDSNIPMDRLSQFTRFTMGGVLIFIMFLLTTILVKLELVGGAFFQGSLFGLVAGFPFKMMKAALEGQAVAGIFATVISLISITIFSDVTNSALMYFILALVFDVATVILFICLKKSPYFNYYANRNDSLSEKMLVSKTGEKHESQSFRSLLNHVIVTMREVMLPGICVYLTLAVTLALFPGIFIRIEPMAYNKDDPWTGKYFIPVVVFLIFNVFDYIGRMVGSYVKWPKKESMLLTLALVLLRLVFVPLAIFCNAKPRNYLPVLFHTDAAPILINIAFAFTNGYLIAVPMIFGPSFASPSNSESAGMALTIYLVLGLATGVTLSIGVNQAF